MTTENTTSDMTAEEPKRGRKALNESAAPMEKVIPDPMEMIEVIIQRPPGVTDSHAYFGFNEFQGQYAYDKPVTMPRAMVEHLRNSRGVEYHADERGNPVPSYTNSFSIVDVRN